MEAKEVADLFVDSVGKIEFYWNFYTVTIIALIGWLVSAKKPMAPRLKLFITLGFLAFTFMNYLGLWGSYTLTEALKNDLTSMVGNEMANTMKILKSKNFLTQMQIGLFIHFIVDIAAIYMVWRVRIIRDTSD